MAGKFRGVQAIILNEQPLALYTHCLNHSLNLVISKSCEERYVKNMLGIVSHLSVFSLRLPCAYSCWRRSLKNLEGNQRQD